MFGYEFRGDGAHFGDGFFLGDGLLDYLFRFGRSAKRIKVECFGDVGNAGAGENRFRISDDRRLVRDQSVRHMNPEWRGRRVFLGVGLQFAGGVQDRRDFEQRGRGGGFEIQISVNHCGFDNADFFG